MPVDDDTTRLLTYAEIIELSLLGLKGEYEYACKYGRKLTTLNTDTYYVKYIRTILARHRAKGTSCPCPAV